MTKLLLEVVNGALMPLMVLVVAAFINSAVSYVNGSGNLAPLIFALVLLAAYYAYSQVRHIIVRLSDKSLENALRENLRPQLIQKQARTSFALLENPESLDLISRVSNSSEKNMAAMLNTGIDAVRLCIQVIGTLSLLAPYAWWMIPLFIASSIPIALIARKGGKAIYASDVITTKLTRRHYYLSNILVSRETAEERTLFGYTDAINKKFSAAHLKRSNMVTKEIAMEEVTVNACSLILNALVLVAVFMLLRPVGAGAMSHGLYVSLIGALIGLARMITGSVSRLVSDTTGFIEFMRDYARFFALPEIDTTSVGFLGNSIRTASAAGYASAADTAAGYASAADTVADTAANTIAASAAESSSATDIAAASGFDSLRIRNLRFRYTPDSHYVLNGVSLTIEHGKSYSLIGRNGAGKSTLTKILLGLYRDFEGEIFINGVDISNYSAEGLRSLFSIVYQDYAKYYIPLCDNITLGNESGNFDSALRLAELSDAVGMLPQKEKTPLGKIYDGGMDISGGEWQKVAIARALYANTPFMILDEPTANLSPMMESKLYRRFAEITKGKTSLLISHRLGSTKLSDELFVLDGGAIVETGTHDELMAANGIYAEMFKSQRNWYEER